MAQRRTREQWTALVLAFDRTSQTAAVFCAARGVTLSTFRWWRSQLRKADEVVGGSVGEPVRLLAIDVAGPVRTPTGPVVIAFAGLEIRTEVGVDVGYVAALVAELRTRC